MKSKVITLTRILLILSPVITFLVIISGNIFTQKISIEVGQIAQTTIYAPFQVENELATNRKRDSAQQAVQPIYKIDTRVQEKAITDLDELFNQTLLVKNMDTENLLNKDQVDILRERVSIPLYKDEYQVLLNASDGTIETLRDLCINSTVKMLESGIKNDDTNNLLKIEELTKDSNLHAIEQKIAASILQTVIKPNVIPDDHATSEAEKAAREKVEPVYVLQGEKIIEKGTRVTEETYRLLEKVGYLDNNKSDRYVQYLGIAILIAILCLLSYRYNRQSKRIAVLKNNQINLLLILYIASLIVIRIMLGVKYIYLPLIIAPILIAILIRVDVAIMYHIILVIVTSFTYKGDLIFISYFLTTGIFSILIMATMHERNQTMRSAVFIGLFFFSIHIVLKLLIGTSLSMTLLMESALSLIVAMLAVFLAIGSLPLWEALFGFITPLQLLELTNPNQPILKRLLIEATGTYYHSLLVANLAEAAADAIGANPLMARVGGYYHDIGKIKNPDLFKENQIGDNPHDSLTPDDSFLLISSHVSYGLELSEQYKLPKYIKDIIVQHHGTSLMQYFYSKAVKLQGEDVSKEKYSYNGPKPKTKEAALVMLADIVEATSRSLQEKIGNEIIIEELVGKLVRQKLEEGQLDECYLYIADINKIVDTFSKVLKGMYHQRVKYPERNDK